MNHTLPGLMSTLATQPHQLARVAATLESIDLTLRRLVELLEEAKQEANRG